MKHFCTVSESFTYLAGCVLFPQLLPEMFAGLLNDLDNIHVCKSTYTIFYMCTVNLCLPSLLRVCKSLQTDVSSILPSEKIYCIAVQLHHTFES